MDQYASQHMVGQCHIVDGSILSMLVIEFCKELVVYNVLSCIYIILYRVEYAKNLLENLSIIDTY